MKTRDAVDAWWCRGFGRQCYVVNEPVVIGSCGSGVVETELEVTPERTTGQRDCRLGVVGHVAAAA